MVRWIERRFSLVTQLSLHGVACALVLFGVVTECESNERVEEPLVYLTNSMTFTLNFGYCAFEIYAHADTDFEITDLKIGLEAIVQDPDSPEEKKKGEKVEFVIDSVGGSSVNAYS